MYFHTWPFLFFFTIVFLGHVLLRKSPLHLWWLLIASYVFYGWWNPWFLLLIFYSTLIDYGCVLAMERSGYRGVWLAVSLVNNLLLLGFFKYALFATDSVNALLASVEMAYQIPTPDILLPVGISFFTFQSMSYTIDYYRGNILKEPSLIRFATYVAFFPQLVAGPIERASSLLPQLSRPVRIDVRDVTDGLSLFVVGLFKKKALADYLAMYVDPIYLMPERFDGATLAIATIAFAWQIYFDFSGYTDMARGIAGAMGYRLMLNFRHPYLATSLSDFWSRWHISLSTWFRDYVYIPLGGNQGGAWRTYANIFATMAISGLWHGASWNFVIWGALHGCLACLLRPLERSAWYLRSVPQLVKRAGVFTIVCIAWIFFRAETLPDALTIVQRIVSSSWQVPDVPVLAVLLVAAVYVYQWVSESRWSVRLEVPWVQVGLITAMLVYLWLVPGGSNQAFLYFQF